jgi:hypothetical protein
VERNDIVSFFPLYPGLVKRFGQGGAGPDIAEEIGRVRRKSGAGWPDGKEEV